MVPAGSPSTETPRAGAGRFPAWRARAEHRRARELSRDLDAEFVVEWQLLPINEPSPGSGADKESALRLSEVGA